MTYHMHNEPPIAPIMSKFRLPIISIRYRSQMKVIAVFITPKMPVVKKPVFVPWIPMLSNTVGL